MSRPPDYRYWSLRELWTVRDAAHLLLGIRSGSVMSVYQLGQISTIMDWVQDAIDIRTLKPFSSAENSKPLEDRRVRPTEFLKWWQSKGRTVPAELAHLLDEPEQQQASEEEPAPLDNDAMPLKKTERRLLFITSAARTLDYELLAIPDGGKKRIRVACLKDSGLFTPSTFEYAWKVARNRELVKLLNNDKYKPG